jgi:hypothetical protein
MDDSRKRPQHTDEAVVPAKPDGTVPYADPLPTAAADAAAPDGSPRPTRPGGRSDHDAEETNEAQTGDA